MVSLPLFKFAALFVRHISKYGGVGNILHLCTPEIANLKKNLIKAQAHDHPKFRAYAVYYGQKMHQINMRMAVTLLKNTAVEKRAKEKGEFPSLRPEEQSNQGVLSDTSVVKEKNITQEASPSVWKRKFRSLPEAKAVDLFADVLGDTFVLLVAGSLIFYEYIRSKGKPDVNAEKISELYTKLEELHKRESDLERASLEAQNRFITLEQSLKNLETRTKGKHSVSPA